MPRSSPEHRELLHARQLVTLTTPREILGAACRELLVATNADRVLAGYCAPNQDWAHSIHIEGDDAGTRDASPAMRSALFALHRKMSLHRDTVELVRSVETAPIFDGIGCERRMDTIVAVPIVHRTGRVWGELVVPGASIASARMQTIRTLAQLATVALENAQRLAFARRDQDRLLMIGEASSDALYDWNFDTKDFWWGGGIVKLFGAGWPIDTSQRWKQERIHPEDRERVRLSLEAALAARATTWTCEYRFQRVDGTYLDIEDRGYFQCETDGRAYRMVGSMHDVTAIKAALVREQQARRDAESASRAKDEFLAMLGHELRNPLAPIVTGLQLLRMRTPQDRELDVLERQAEHLVRLVDDLLDISRIAHGKIELKRERLEIASVIATAVEVASPLVRSRNHVLSTNVPARGLVVDGDRARLAQAIGNVLNNAAKYTEPGGAIAVNAKRDSADVVISVRDTGIGIAPQMLPNVFSMFVQERQALDRAQGGLGLGLAIVRSMLELHGGRVEARSDGPNRGTEIVMRIPVATAEVTAAAPQSSGKLLRRPSGRRILVVDDNVDAADLLSIMLERMGNTTRVAHDPRDALRMLDEATFDLAVLDIGLPEMDGYELARRVREHPTSKQTRLIALSGYGQAKDREKSAGAGFDAHLVKPVVVEALAQLIDDLAPVPAA